MRIGVPTEIKKQESRVGLTPESVGELVRAGHEVSVQSGAGIGSMSPSARKSCRTPTPYSPPPN